MYNKCNQSYVKLDYACKSHNDIYLILIKKLYLLYQRPEEAILFKDELSALCHSSNYAKYRVLLDRVIIMDKASLIHPRTKQTPLNNLSTCSLFIQ